MPFAVTHILTSLFCVDFYRKKVIKRKDFPLWLVLIGGIAGLLPDIDFAIYWLLKPFTNLQLTDIHGLYTHTLLIPVILLAIALLLRKYKTTFHVLIITSMGYTTHILLDMLFSETKPLFYPFSTAKIGFAWIPEPMIISVFASLDAILLVLWLIYEWRMKNIREYT